MSFFKSLKAKRAAKRLKSQDTLEGLTMLAVYADNVIRNTDGNITIVVYTSSGAYSFGPEVDAKMPRLAQFQSVAATATVYASACTRIKAAEIAKQAAMICSQDAWGNKKNLFSGLA